MAAFECRTEVLRCPNCGLTGVANLSQPKHVDAVIVIDTMSEGFKPISSQYGDTYFCEGCNRPATEIRTGKRTGETSASRAEITATGRYLLWEPFWR